MIDPGSRFSLMPYIKASGALFQRTLVCSSLVRLERSPLKDPDLLESSWKVLHESLLKREAPQVLLNHRKLCFPNYTRTKVQILLCKKIVSLFCKSESFNQFPRCFKDELEDHLVGITGCCGPKFLLSLNP